MANIRTFLGTDKDISSLFDIQGVHNLHLNLFYIKETATIQRGVLSVIENKDGKCQR
jgi:hypothetical protein